ncbi:hypothetical protein CYMTET_12066 [Cymbomonas tetramitiformis]|uniref:Uncharacterized protein n=1 Tax=Cymbomonas tetramitiformis TaxID=36881 RepID=A0AAE0LCU4_9CHLO|nr:hypothetical protein CYMTET_12066 [Cymbomonas tetramitiformis]|eukprot:gene11575-13675_t
MGSLKAMLDDSIFAPRKKEALSGDYFDTTEMRNKMFKLDWGRMDKKPTFIAFKKKNGLALEDKETGKLKPTPLLKFYKNTMRTEYDVICNAYTYYICREKGSPQHAMSQKEFEEFCFHNGLRDCADASKKKFGFMNLTRLFQELNEEPDPANKKKKAENAANDDDALMRFEFLELIIRLSWAFPQSPEPKTQFQGYLMYVRSNFMREAQLGAIDRNVFRKERLYTPEVLAVLKAYQEELRTIYTLAVGTDPGIGKDSPKLSYKKWCWLSERCEFEDTNLFEGNNLPLACGGIPAQGLHRNELTLIFMTSMMMVPDEIKHRDLYNVASFTEFLEALCRVAESKDLATKEALEQFEFMSTVNAIYDAAAQVKAKKKPKIARRPSSEFWANPEKTRSLAERVLSFLDYMFLKFEPDCGSVLMSTYESAKLLGSLASESKQLYGKVMWA